MNVAVVLQAHVQQQHQLSESAARNGLLILEEAHMVLQFATPTRISSLMELIKNKNTSESTTTSPPANAAHAQQETDTTISSSSTVNVDEKIGQSQQENNNSNFPEVDMSNAPWKPKLCKFFR